MVFEFDVVGFTVVDQQTPLAMIAEVPGLVIFPPDVAEVEPISETAVVESAGRSGGGADVVNEI